MSDPSQRRDVRPRLLAAVLADPRLSPREKVYVFTVAMVRAETLNGRRRPGSRGMNERAVYSLHPDYIARCMGASVDAVRRAREALSSAENGSWLSLVHPGTYGRPACYQALVGGTFRAPLRVASTATLTSAPDCHPYETSGSRVSVASAASLASTGADQGRLDHAEAAISTADAVQAAPASLFGSRHGEAADHAQHEETSLRIQRCSAEYSATASPAGDVSPATASGASATTDRAREDGMALQGPRLARRTS